MQSSGKKAWASKRFKVFDFYLKNCNLNISNKIFYMHINCSATESYLMKGKDGQIGITGEGSLIDSAKGIELKNKVHTLKILNYITAF